jgi:poly(A) polymerase
MELLNLLGLPDPAPTVHRMEQLGVLAQILPEARPDALTRLIGEERRQEVAPAAIRRLAALLPADAALAEQIAARFRLSGAQKKRLVIAAGRDGKPGDPRALAYRLGREEALDRLLMADADISPLLSWAIPEFPLKGGEIVARGIKAGPEVARILKAIETRWVEEGFPSGERIEALLCEELSRHKDG